MNDMVYMLSVIRSSNAHIKQSQMSFKIRSQHKSYVCKHWHFPDRK